MTSISTAYVHKYLFFHEKYYCLYKQKLIPEESTELFEVIKGPGYSIKKLEDFNNETKSSSISKVSEMMNRQHFYLVAIPD